jgi:uncharacterized protein (TIGR02246 family)
MKFSKFSKLSSFLLLGFFGTKAVLSGKKEGRDRNPRSRAAVEAMNAKCRDALRLGKPAELAAFYAEDAYLLPPNGELIQGRQGIEAFWNKALDMGVKDLVLTTVDVIVRADTIAEVGTYVSKVWPEGKGGSEDKGKYVVVWKRKVDGSLVILADIWNSSLPAARP